MNDETRNTTNLLDNLKRRPIVYAALGLIFGAILGLIIGGAVGGAALGLIFGAGAGLISGSASNPSGRVR